MTTLDLGAGVHHGVDAVVALCRVRRPGGPSRRGTSQYPRPLCPIARSRPMRSLCPCSKPVALNSRRLPARGWASVTPSAAGIAKRESRIVASNNHTNPTATTDVASSLRQKDREMFSTRQSGPKCEKPAPTTTASRVVHDGHARTSSHRSNPGDRQSAEPPDDVPQPAPAPRRNGKQQLIVVAAGQRSR